MKAFNLSRFTRLWLVIGSCAVFFFVEIAIGLHTRSLALIVDAFHMLNDLISYVVALVAAKLAASNKVRPGFTYALKRCEVVGAFFNSSILLALAVSIFLQSIERFIEVPEVENPMLVLIDGCVGLALNVFCVLVCHEGHGHSHGHGHGHSHGHHGHGHSHEHHDSHGHHHHNHTHTHADHRSHSHSHHTHIHSSDRPDTTIEHEVRAVKVPNIASQIYRPLSHYMHSHHEPHNSHGVHGGQPGPISRSRSKFTIFGHQITAYGRGSHNAPHPDVEATSSSQNELDKHASLDPGSPKYASPESEKWYQNEEGVIKRERKGRSGVPAAVNHTHRPQGQGHTRDVGPAPAVHDHHHGHDHSHGSHMGISGVMLHVAGDAINNLGVVIAALFMWLVPWPSRFYADPGVSVLIGIIIFAGSVPLTLRSARLLLEAAPKGMDVEAIKLELSQIPGVTSVRCLHIWQLTESDLVSSLEVRSTARDLVVWSLTEKEIRRALEQHNVRHVTIAPEFIVDEPRPSDGEKEADVAECQLVRGE